MAESQAKHTPGPCGDRHEIDRAYSEAHERIRNAAPDLLAALEDLIERAGTSMHQANSDGAEYDVDAELKAAYAAIAKARGA